ncbi:hypothetical protein KC19_VG159600, partial [Ceratodon purpureus]
ATADNATGSTVPACEIAFSLEVHCVALTSAVHKHWQITKLRVGHGSHDHCSLTRYHCLQNCNVHHPARLFSKRNRNTFFPRRVQLRTSEVCNYYSVDGLLRLSVVPDCSVRQ